ncbi:acetyl-CoA carboxylase biotin carboxyl carrier protein [Actinomadura harenae]|uniref:Biotin carboxyl carrier protein of acetyl-CoA carboxylase n=1 Tax=Actinomadura harenae TaxID=2483351 RepID=A0A3M2M7T0_9ACTN|nr:biotin/lipoyl-containing protein [Actinomadura harenae]RMI43168.1 acetyl-CoA carboxylase, biotin carboxyl carrier protein [Actinomadura harenae]
MTNESAERRPLEEVCRGVTDLIAAAGGSLRRIAFRSGDAEVEMEWAAPEDGLAGTAPSAPRGPAPAPGTEGLVYVRAGMVGTFYVAPEPGGTPFVSEGDLVRPGQQVAILEVMKLLAPVEADRPGRVVEFLVKDGESVEYGTPLIALDPGSDG